MNTQSENIADFALAMAKAQGEIRNALKDSSNPFFNSKYADLSAVSAACKMELSKNEIAVLQGGEEFSDTSFIFVTNLLHSSGQWYKSKLPASLIIPASPSKTDKYGKTIGATPERRMTPQELGSAITYLRRYGLCCAVGIVADEDDDGNKASGTSGTHAYQTNSVPSPSNKISKKEVQELKSILDGIPEYKSKLESHLRDNFSMTSFDELTHEMYNNIRLEAMKQKRPRNSQQKTA